jgi:hypothetical protein
VVSVDRDLTGEKTLATLNRARTPAKIQRTIPSPCEGSFVERGGDILAFGEELLQRRTQAKPDLGMEPEPFSWTASAEGRNG